MKRYGIRFFATPLNALLHLSVGFSFASFWFEKACAYALLAMNSAKERYLGIQFNSFIEFVVS